MGICPNDPLFDKIGFSLLFIFPVQMEIFGVFHFRHRANQRIEGSLGQPIDFIYDIADIHTYQAIACINELFLHKSTKRNGPKSIRPILFHSARRASRRMESSLPGRKIPLALLRIHTPTACIDEHGGLSVAAL